MPDDFFSLYDGVDRVDLRGDFWVDIKRCLTQAEAAHANYVLVGDKIVREGNPDRLVNTMKSDHQAYKMALLTAHIVAWNITRQGVTLPLPPYIPPQRPAGDDKANLVRRESIAQLPEPVVDKIWKRISDNEKLFAEDDTPDPDATFPGPGEGAPAAP